MCMIVIQNWANLRGTLIERNPPPRGGFSFTVFPHQEPCVIGPPSKDLSNVSSRGSSYTWLSMREHSKSETLPGGGGDGR